MNLKVCVSRFNKIIVSLCLGMIICGCDRQPQYYLYVYYAKTCPVCRSFINHVIPELEKEYKDQMTITYFDIDEESSMDNYAKTCSLLKDYYLDDESGSIPFIVLDGYFAKVGYEIGQQDAMLQAIHNAIANEPLSSELNDVYYFQAGKTFH